MDFYSKAAMERAMKIRQHAYDQRPAGMALQRIGGCPDYKNHERLSCQGLHEPSGAE
jgi:hypothetical protein